MSGNSSSSGAIYLGIAFALIGVLMLTIFYFGTAGSRRFFREGESVLGTVVDVETWTVGRDRNYRTTIEFQSESDGRVTDVMPLKAEVGDEIDFVYNPDFPRDSLRIDSWGGKWLPHGVMVPMGLMFLGFGVGIFMKGAAGEW